MEIRIIWIAFAVLLASCSSTKNTDSYAAREPYEHFQEIVVLAILPDEKAGLRENIENNMAEDLCQMGYYTLSSLDAYGRDAFCGMCKEEIMQKLQRDQVNAVLTVTLVAQNDEKKFIEEKLPRLRSLSFYDYQTEKSAQAERQGYYFIETYYYWETNLYRVRDQKLLYSARTDTVNPNSAQTFAKEYARLVIADMVQQHVFEKPREINPFLQ